MADRTTYFKIDRSIFDNWLWNEKPFDKLHAWVYLIGHANFAETKKLYKGQLQVIKRGQIATSYQKLAEDWGWSRCKVIRFLKLLESDGMLKVDGTARGTTLTLENYGKFQSLQYTNDTTNDTAPDTAGDTAPDTHNKKEKKEKNNKNLSPPSRGEVAEWVSSLGLGVNPDEFYDIYEDAGWTDAKGQPIRNWKALCRKWASTQSAAPYKKEPTAMEKIMAEIKARKEAEQ